MDKDKILSVSQVKFGEDSGSLKELKSKGDEWKRALVLDSYLIQSLVVYTEAEISILLAHKEVTSPHQKGCRSDYTCG